jgi:hypothetical protein
MLSLWNQNLIFFGVKFQPFSSIAFPFANTFKTNVYKLSWWRGLVVTSPPVTEETAAMGRGIESRVRE